MKVLVVHNAYQQFGGEDVVVRAESDLLAGHGNLAGLYIVSNDRIVGMFSKLTAALGVVFSWTSYRSLRKLIRDIRPDVVHVHNFFPLLSPAVFYACRAEHVPVVFTLHNYRIVCPTALLMHNGVVTERSLQEGPWWAIKYRVYRDSVVGTFLICLMIWLHHRMGTWRNQVSRFIVLSKFAQDRFTEAGLPAGALVMKPNFVDLPGPGEQRNRSGFLFVGRLSAEKGIDVLLAATLEVQQGARGHSATVNVAGDGPLKHRVERSGGVLFLGALPHEQVRKQMHAANALLLPSIWYEGFPMVLVEAYASGLPVIASRIGALAELVEDGVTGLLFDPGNADSLASKMIWALEHQDEIRRMGLAARRRYEERYTPAQNYQQLMAIYQSVARRDLAHDHGVVPGG